MGIKVYNTPDHAIFAVQQKILVTKRFEDEVISRNQDIASCYNQIKLLDEETSRPRTIQNCILEQPKSY